MNFFKRITKLFKRKTPIIQQIYEIPPHAIIGQIIGRRFDIKATFNDLREAFVGAIREFIEIGTPYEAGKNLPAFTLIVHPELRYVLEIPMDAYNMFSFLQWVFKELNFKQIVVDKRLYTNEICIEDWSNISDTAYAISLLKENNDISYTGNFGVNRYCIYLENNYKEKLR